MQRTVFYVPRIYLTTAPDFHSPPRVLACPETGTKACSDRYTGGQKVNTVLLLLQHIQFLLISIRNHRGYLTKQIIHQAKKNKNKINFPVAGLCNWRANFCVLNRNIEIGSSFIPGNIFEYLYVIYLKGQWRNVQCISLRSCYI